MSRLTDRELAVLTTLCRTAIKAKPDYAHGQRLLSALEELAELRAENEDLSHEPERRKETLLENVQSEPRPGDALTQSQPAKENQ